MKSSENLIKFGTFKMPSGKQVIGELCIAGEESYLLLADTEPLCREELSLERITGTLYDNTKVTLIQCVSLETHHPMRVGDYHSWKIFPHFVICGHSYLSTDVNSILNIKLFLEDASTLMFDFDAFGIAIDGKPHINNIVEAQSKKVDREIQVGENSVIAYFTGNYEIFRVNTVIGDVYSNHNVKMNSGGPDGVRIDNAISVSITPEQPIDFHESIAKIVVLLRFFELVIGRLQIINNFNIKTNEDDELLRELKVYWSLIPNTNGIVDQPHPGDVLTDPIRRKSEFCSVLTHWLSRDAERKDARIRFSNCFALGNSYTIDRLIGAANMFDILPNSATPNEVELSTELTEAKSQCKSIFKDLPNSPERSSVLGALGRLGKSSLKHKVRFRAKCLLDSTDNRFPDLIEVLDQAVDCRNHYVHGSASKISFSDNTDLVVFFTKTFEFVFAASELIESGWDINAWLKNGTTMSHPFGAYCVDYAGYLELFRNKVGK